MFAARPREEAAWEPVLARLQAELDEHRRQLELAEGRENDAVDVGVVPGFVPPSDLPPLPAAFADWATSLARETEELAEMARAYLDRNRPVPGTRRLHTPTNAASGPSLIDRKL